MNYTDKEIENLLAGTFPALPVLSVQFIGEGMDSRAYTINGKYVFRFPKRPEAAANLQKEIVLLPYLQNLPLAIPDFKFVGRDPSTGWSFAGYPLLQGEEWTSARYTRQTAKDQQTSLQLIGHFLMAVHSFDADRALQLGIEEAYTLNDYLDTYEQLQRTLYPHLTANQQRVIDQHFNTYLNNAALYPPERTLIHADFSTDHILCDRDTGKPQGVIDFGDIAVGDPDLDLKYLFEEMGPQVISELLQKGYYRSNMPDSYLLDKLAFYHFCDTITDTVQRYEHNPALIPGKLPRLSEDF